MLSTLVLATWLTASPGYAVVVTRRLSVSAERALEVATALTRAVDDVQLEGLGPSMTPEAFVALLATLEVTDPGKCTGAPECAAGLARRAQLPRVVSLQVAQLGKALTVDARLVSAEGSVLSTATVTTSAKATPALFSSLARELVAPLQAQVASAPSEETPAVGEPTAALAPVPPPPPPMVTIASAPPPRGLGTGRTAALVVGGGGVVGLGVGGVLGLVALNDARKLGTPGDRVTLASVRATALAADVAFISGGALLAGAIVTWLLTGEPSPAANPIVVGLTGEGLHVSGTW